MENQIGNDKKTYPVSGARAVFNGTSAERMFTAQTVPLPELAPGEILVKVKTKRSQSLNKYFPF